MLCGLAFPAGGWAAAPASAPTTAPGRLTLSTWAAAGNLKNPVALSFDRDGRAYVAQTQRREGGEMQVKSKPANTLPDHTFVTVEDRSKFGGDGDASWGAQTGGKKETITLLEDSHHTGKADKASVFYEGFDRNMNDILAGVLWFDGAVYATIAPDLWMLRDPQHAGHAEEVKSLSHGYAVHMGYNGHNMHGLTVGPDGKIYFTMGDKGVNITTPDGRRLVYPNTGTCLRCNPDGSGLEVFAYGLRNVQEVAFDRYGNLFSVDNDGDFPTERERFVYITQDSDTGWRFHWQFRSKRFDATHEAGDRKDRYNVWLAEKLWVPYFAGQPSHITPALSNYSDGPCGFKYATEGSLNERYRGYFFLVQFPKALVTAFTAKPKGAYFTMTNDHVVSNGVQCTGLALGPDGALYGAEWGKSAFKLGNTGSVVKFDDPAAAQSPLRKETALLLHEGAAYRSIGDLVRLLGHADMRVRMDAQFELAKRKAAAELVHAAFAADGAQMSRIHGMWGIGQMIDAKTIDKEAASEIAKKLVAGPLADKDAEIRTQGVKLLQTILVTYGPVIDDELVIRLLGDESLRVRFFAAMALGKFHDAKAATPLLQLLAENKPFDPYIRHAAVMGLVGSGNAEALVACAKAPQPAVRQAAIVALRRMGNAGVARFLGDLDEAVATDAARAIHDDASIPEALPALANALERPGIVGEAFLRRALNANYRLGGPEAIQRLVRYAAGDRNPAALRVEAVEMLAAWEEPPINDRVEGIYRTWPKRDAEEVRQAISTSLPSLIGSKDPTIARATTRLIGQLNIKTDDSTFAAWITDDDKPAASRVTALRLLAARKYAKLGGAVDAALASGEPALRSEAVRVLATTDPKRAIQQITAILAGQSIPEQQASFEVLGSMPGPAAIAVLGSAMNRLLAGKLPTEVQLDLLDAAALAAEKHDDKALAAQLKAYHKSLSKSDPLAPYLVSLAGGDAERGREIFTAHSDAACIRCHSTDGAGSTVGPNLAGIAAKPDKPRHYLLESMITPNAVIVPGFGIASFHLKSGDDVSGIVKAETDTEVQLLDLEGQSSALKQSDIESRTPPVSMMPAMGSILSKSEIRDVIEYLSSLKPPPPASP